MTYTFALILVMMLSFLGSTTSVHAQTYDIADSLWNEAVAAGEAGAMLNAAQLYEQSAEAVIKCETPRHEDMYYALRNASYYYHQVNEYEKAFELSSGAQAGAYSGYLCFGPGSGSPHS